MEHLEQLRCSGLFEKRVPRYTSYPPVNRFVVGEGALRQQRWLRAVPHGATVSLYVHIPYCETICWFCACRTQAVDEKSTIENYVSILLQEIAQIRAQLPASIFLNRLHMGGGTPTMLTPERMQTLLDSIYEAFPRATGFECSIEIDTTNVTTEMIECLISNGMNRAIVGVQDFDKKVQKEIGRPQSFEQTLDIVRQLRHAGLESLDMELLYGLPRQSRRTIAETTQHVLAFDPDRIAVCEYAHVPNLAKRQILIDARYLPSAEDAFQMFQVARHILVSDGYEAVGMDHYVRPGDKLIKARDEKRLKRDFQGYSDNASHALIGLGASAISHFPQGYVQNASATSVYCSAIEKNCLAGHLGYDLTHMDRVLACMIEMLMCRFEIDLDDVRQVFPAERPLIDTSIATLRKVFGPYVETSSQKLVIKPEAQPLARLMCNTLDHLRETELNQ